MKRIAIIGAGPAGLAAAYELLNYSSDYNIEIFEQEDSVGGLSRSFFFSGGTVDIGGHRFYTKDSSVQKLWDNILPVSAYGMLTRERVSHIVFKNKLIEYPIKINIQTMESLGIKDSLKVLYSYLRRFNENNEIHNLKDYYINQFGEVLYSLFFMQYTEKLWGIPAEKLSSEWGVQRIQGISLFDFINLTFKSKCSSKRSLISTFNYPAFGSGQLWCSLAKYIENAGVKIHTNSKICGLKCSGNRIISILISCNEVLAEKSFDYVLSSMPLKELVLSTNSCPSLVKNVASHLWYRDMIIVGLEVHKDDASNVLKSAQRDCWLYVQDSHFTFGRIQILNNWSPYLVKSNNCLLLELEYFCTADDMLWCTSDADIISCALNELVFGNFLREDVSPRSTIVRRIHNAYPIYTDGYKDLGIICNWVNSVDNLRCMGRNGQHRYNNMDHSVRAGIEAARSITSDNYDKSKLWRFNNEDEYVG